MKWRKILLSVGGTKSAGIIIDESGVRNNPAPDHSHLVQLSDDALELMNLQCELSGLLDSGCRNPDSVANIRNCISDLWDRLSDQEQEAARNLALSLSKGKDWEWLQSE